MTEFMLGLAGATDAQIENLLLGLEEGGEQVAQDEVDGIGVSTVKTRDLGQVYETAIRDAAGDWHPVERLEPEATVDDALRTHGEWVHRIRRGERKFTDLGYPVGDLLEPFEFEVHDVSE